MSGQSTPSVLYATSAAGAKPGLQYQSHNYLRDFPPAETRITDTEIGSLVTVTLNGTVDNGSTSFTLLMPRVNVGLGKLNQAYIRTIGITTVHRPGAPPFNGQAEIYSIAELDGTAEFIPF
jgi:hypothetical protein